MVWIWRLSHALQKVPSYTDLKSAICPGISSKKYQSKKCPLIYSLKNGLLPRKKINKNCFTYKAGPRQSFLISKKSPHHHVRYDTKTPKNFWGIPLTKNCPLHLFIWKRQNAPEFLGFFLPPHIQSENRQKPPEFLWKKLLTEKAPSLSPWNWAKNHAFLKKIFPSWKKVPSLPCLKTAICPVFCYEESREWLVWLLRALKIWHFLQFGKWRKTYCSLEKKEKEPIHEETATKEISLYWKRIWRL